MTFFTSQPSHPLPEITSSDTEESVGSSSDSSSAEISLSDTEESAEPQYIYEVKLDRRKYLLISSNKFTENEGEIFWNLVDSTYDSRNPSTVFLLPNPEASFTVENLDNIIEILRIYQSTLDMEGDNQTLTKILNTIKSEIKRKINEAHKAFNKLIKSIPKSRSETDSEPTKEINPEDTPYIYRKINELIENPSKLRRFMYNKSKREELEQKIIKQNNSLRTRLQSFMDRLSNLVERNEQYEQCKNLLDVIQYYEDLKRYLTSVKPLKEKIEKLIETTPESKATYPFFDPNLFEENFQNSETIKTFLEKIDSLITSFQTQVNEENTGLSLYKKKTLSCLNGLKKNLTMMKNIIDQGLNRKAKISERAFNEAFAQITRNTADPEPLENIHKRIQKTTRI